MKKYIITLILLTTLSMAVKLELHENINPNRDYVNGARNVLIHYTFEEHLNKKESTDWIAVYKQGASTDWENVITWTWIKDLPDISTHGYFNIFSDTHFTEAGEYEVRYFKDNSYVIDQAVNFTVKEVDSYLNSLYISPYDEEVKSIELTGFDKKNFVPAKKDWVGIYKINDDNTWENVIQWAWANELKDKEYHHIYRLKLNLDTLEENVQYEARYFLKNSFKTYKKSQPFYVGKLPEHEQERVTCTRILHNENQPNGLFACVTPDYRVEPSKTWVGLFKKDVEAKNHDNLLAWAYLDKEKDFNVQELKILKPELLIDGQEYQTVYFINDSYKQEGKAYTFVLDNFN